MEDLKKKELVGFFFFAVSVFSLGLVSLDLKLTLGAFQLTQLLG